MCNEIFIRGKHDQSGEGAREGGGERRCVSKKGVEGASSRAQGQARNKNRPLTLSAVTRIAASARRTLCKGPKILFLVGFLSLSSLVQQVAAVLGFCNSHVFFFFFFA